MQGVPHWQLFMLIYLLAVGVPVMLVHYKIRKRIQAERTTKSLLLYFAAVLGTALIMHFITMIIYFKFLFTH